MSILYLPGFVSILNRSGKPKARELGQWFESEMMKIIQKMGMTDNEFNSDQMSKGVSSGDETMMKYYLGELAFLISDAKHLRKVEIKIKQTEKDPFDDCPF